MIGIDEWIDQLSSSAGHAIAIESPCVVCQPRIGLALAEHLRAVEGSPWLMLNDRCFEQLQAEAAFRNFVGLDKPSDLHASMQVIAAHGNVVLEMTHAQRATASVDSVFQVSLSCKEPDNGRHHLWLSGKSEPANTLIPRIADNFLAWSDDRKI